MRSTVCIFLFLLVSAWAHADTDVELVIDDLGIPWGMTFIDDERLFVAEKVGTVKIVNINTAEVEEVDGVPEIELIGQGGLMDVARSPNFSEDSKLYFTYAKPIKDSRGKTTAYATALATARLEGMALIEWQDLFVSNIQTTGRRHFGSRIAFDENGYVFFSHGDRGEREDAQDLSNHAGTVLRLHLDGTVPKDNPFINTPNAMPEIWSYGHRNPQGLFYDSTSKRLWSNEHGPRGGDEINLVVKGGNYGWPTLSYGREYVSRRLVSDEAEREGYESPLKHYIPSIAPSSLIVYSGDKYPQWQGALLSGALVLEHLNVVELDQNGNEVSESRDLEDLSKRIRNIVQGPEGHLYVATDSGDIYKLLNHLEQ